MAFLRNLNRFLSEMVDTITSSPDTIGEFIRTSDRYSERLERWQFADRIINTLLYMVCLLSLLVLNMGFRSENINDTCNTVILGSVFACLGMLLFACRHYVAMEKDRCKREYTRDISLAMFGILSSYIQAKRRLSLSNLLVSGEQIVSNIYTLLTIFGPAFAILAPTYHRFFKLHSAMGSLHRNKQECFGFISAIYQSIWQRFERLYMRITGISRTKKIISGLSVAIIALAATWYTVRKYKSTSNCIPTRVVPKRRQDISEDTSLFPPAFCRNTLASIPTSPQFKGSTLVNNSLVRVKASYIATAFRCGNNLLSAMHCVGLKNANSKEEGIWVQNPEDGKYYWAPVEKYFLNEKVGDGLAICSLPNAPFFLGLKSVSLNQHKPEEYVMTFTCDTGSSKPSWSESVGPSYANEEYGLCFMYSTVKPGSSGGPIMNTDGSIIAIVYAETTYKGEDVNLGILITEEMRHFLVNGGDVKPSTSEVLRQDPSDTEFIEIEEHKQSLQNMNQKSEKNIHGQALEENSKGTKSKNSTGAWWDLKRKPKKSKPSPPLQPDQEHPES